MIIRRPPEPGNTEMKEKRVFANLAKNGGMVVKNPSNPSGKKTGFTEAELEVIFHEAKELRGHGKCRIVSVAGTLQKDNCDISIFMDENGDFWYNKYQMV